MNKEAYNIVRPPEDGPHTIHCPGCGANIPGVDTKCLGGSISRLKLLDGTTMDQQGDFVVFYCGSCSSKRESEQPGDIRQLLDSCGRECGFRPSAFCLYVPEGTEQGGWQTRVWFSGGPSEGVMLAIEPNTFKRLLRGQ
jgi:hypothetical protein